MFFARPFAIAAVLTIPALAQDAPTKEQGKHLIRYSFRAGSVQHSVIEQQMKMVINMGGQEMVTNMKMSMFTTNQIKSTKGNTAAIEQRITRVKAFADSPMSKVDYDSDIKGSDPGALSGLADLVNAKTTLRLSDQGKISDLKMPENAESIRTAGIDLQQVLSQSVTQLPDHPLAIGDTWKVKQELPMGQMGKAETEVVYKLIATNDKVITLAQEMIVDTDKLKAPGAKIDSVTAKGTLKVDVRTGLPIELEMKMSTKMSGQMNMTMDLTQRVRPAPAPAAKPTTGEGKPEEASGKKKTGGGK